MKQYYKREITYDSETQLYTVSVPELGISITSDTEVSGMVEIRKEIAEAARKPREAQATTAEPVSSHTSYYLPQGWTLRGHGLTETY